ncbi:MAG: hypothetical protein LBQ60_07685 [Bacteroidales bacterium]|jgi:hypothetical protein|nr:hypothetical protein [Bacteroidales bacterium]
MKKIKCILLLLAILSVRSYGDIILTEPQSFEICINIKGLDDYPDIALIGFRDCMALWSNSKKAYVVDPNTCLGLSKSCPLTLYAVKKSYLEKKKDVNDIDLKKDKNVIKSSITIDMNDFNIDRSSVKSMDVNFNIAGFDKTSMVLYKASQVIQYKDGRPDSVESFEYEGDLSKLRKKF